MNARYLCAILALLILTAGGGTVLAEEGGPATDGALAAGNPTAVPVVSALTSANCLKCHGKPELRGVTERGATLRLHIPEKDYRNGAHGRMNCVECHAGSEGDKSFAVVPHKLSREESPTCLNCHQKGFNHVVAEVEKSNHYKKVGGKVGCGDCHDPHALRPKMPEDRYADAVSRDNAACVACHTDLNRFRELTGRTVYNQNLSHEFLPEKDKHFAVVRCVECHTPAELGAGEPHRLLPKEESLRDCTACHREKNSLYISRVRTYADLTPGAGGFLGKGLFDEADLVKKLRQAKVELNPNEPLREREIPVAEVKASLAGSYAPGIIRPTGLDHKGGLALLAVFVLSLCHGAARFVGRRGGRLEEIGSEKVYPLYVRLPHWLNAVLFLVLAATGLSIRFPGFPLSLPMGGSVTVHDTAAILLAANFLAFLLVELVTGDIRQYAPHWRGLGGRLGRQLGYYLWGVFRGAPKPFPVTREQRFNPLQQLTYLVVFWIGVPLLVLSGVPLLVSELATETSRAELASIHYVVALVSLAFLILHCYLSTTGERPSTLIRGMISGRHSLFREVPPDKPKD